MLRNSNGSSAWFCRLIQNIEKSHYRTIKERLWRMSSGKHPVVEWNLTIVHITVFFHMRQTQNVLAIRRRMTKKQNDLKVTISFMIVQCTLERESLQFQRLLGLPLEEVEWISITWSNGVIVSGKEQVWIEECASKNWPAQVWANSPESIKASNSKGNS